MKKNERRLGSLRIEFIIHDLSIVRQISDKVAVMYLDRIEEITDSGALYKNPLNHFAQALLSRLPITEPFIEENHELIILKGEIPSSLNLPPWLRFRPRCFHTKPGCPEPLPSGHEVACFGD